MHSQTMKGNDCLKRLFRDLSLSCSVFSANNVITISKADATASGPTKSYWLQKNINQNRQSKFCWRYR